MIENSGILALSGLSLVAGVISITSPCVLQLPTGALRSLDHQEALALLVFADRRSGSKKGAKLRATAKRERLSRSSHAHSAAIT